MENKAITLSKENTTENVAVVKKGKCNILTEKWNNRPWKRRILTEKTLPRTTCLYIHVNIEKQEPFYVGIGADERPYDTLRRNNFWKKTVNKYDYIVVILYVNLTWEEACEKEIYLIAQIGRRDLGKGTLVNLTDGGDGTKNLSKEAAKRMGDAHLFNLTGQKFGRLTVIKRAENRGKSNKIVWFCNCDCGSKNIEVHRIYLMNGETKSCGCARYDRGIPILQLEKNTDKILASFKNIIDAIRITNVHIYDYFYGLNEIGGGYDWRVITTEEYNTTYKEYHNISIHKSLYSKIIKILAIFPDLEEKEFRTTSEAVRVLKIHSETIKKLYANGEAHKKTGIKFKKIN